MGMIKDFKEFALKGNLIDTAIAFVMGAAFGKVVSAFVEKMFSPLVGLLMGGVDLTKLTALPTGYTSYLSLTIKDSPFYDIKEVYKNQVNVDNARALRQMSSDRLHQQLINLQYK